MPTKVPIIMTAIYPIVTYISEIVWFIIPIRQFRKAFFWFFIFLMGGDLLTMAARFLFHSRTNIFYVICTFLCLLSVQWKDKTKAMKFLIFLLGVITLIFELIGMGYRLEFFLITLADILMVFIFLKGLILKIVIEKGFNIFLACLIFYELTVITKYYAIISNLVTGNIYFFITTVFEVLFGLFFLIFTYDDSRVNIKISNPYEYI